MIDLLWNAVIKISVKLTQSHKRSKLKRYLLPIILAALVILAKLLLLNVIPDHTAYHLLMLVVILSAWYGGLGPGLLATFMAAFLDVLVLFSANTPFTDIYSLISLSFFIIGGIIVSFISEARSMADTQKDEFIGIVSHELKNPLTAIKTYAQLLKNKGMAQNSLQYLSKIDQQTGAINAIINDLLDLTRIESGKFIYSEEPFSLYSLVNDIVQDQQFITKTHRIIFTGRSDATVYGDKQKIRQTIVNLLANAVKYSPQSKKIMVKIRDIDSSVELTVRDYGVGIPKDMQGKIFERFFRTQDAERSGKKGLGLGLHIAYNITRYHKGQLWVKSTYGKGSTFHLLLPRQEGVKHN
ncbi:MAG: sensor histidine kinase [Candidatus Levyibacteriota bacterium]